jgi:voltage-gated potassium channel
MTLASVKKTLSDCLANPRTRQGTVVEAVLAAVNLIACLLYVADTYSMTAETHRKLILAEYWLVGFFAIEYILRIWVAEKKWEYVFSFYGIIDLVSIVPIFFTTHGAGFLRVLRILRFLRFLRTNVFSFGRVTEIQLQIVRILFTLFSILFVAAGIIHFYESAAHNNGLETFGDAIYFSVIALTTTGFGDIVPVTTGGRTATVLMILSALILIPWQSGLLIRLLLHSHAGKHEVICTKCGLKYHDKDASHCKACGNTIFQVYEGDS